MSYDDARASVPYVAQRLLDPFAMRPILDTHASAAGYGTFSVRHEAPAKTRCVFTHNNEFWERVFLRQLNPPLAVTLDSFFIFSWLPRAAGLHYTPQAIEARRFAQGHIVDIDGKHVVYDPYGKQSMLDGGVGCIRLRPFDTGWWLLGASSSGVAHEGIPLLVNGDDYAAINGEVAERGCVVRDVKGTLTFLPAKLADEQSSGMPQLCVCVETLEEPSHPKSRRMEELVVTAACSFLGEFEGERNVYATYVSFDPSERTSYEDNVHWLAEEYVGRRYSGQVITDFDQVWPNFRDVPFSLDDVMTLRLRLNLLESAFAKNGLPPEFARKIIARQKELSFFMQENVNNGIAGIVGNSASGNTINFTNALNNVDLNQLAAELAQLRTALRKANPDGEHDAEMGKVAEAETAARAGDRKGVLGALAAAGRWTLGIAKDVGVAVATQALENAMGVK